jgi:hypothetical protein
MIRQSVVVERRNLHGKTVETIMFVYKYEVMRDMIRDIRRYVRDRPVYSGSNEPFVDMLRSSYCLINTFMRLDLICKDKNAND